MDFFCIFLDSSNSFLRAKMRETKGFFLRLAQGVRASGDANIGRLPLKMLLLLLLAAAAAAAQRHLLQ